MLYGIFKHIYIQTLTFTLPVDKTSFLSSTYVYP